MVLFSARLLYILSTVFYRFLEPCAAARPSTHSVFRYVCKTGCLMRAYLMPFLSFDQQRNDVIFWYGVSLVHIIWITATAIVNHFSFPLCKINVFILVRFNAVYVSGACELFLRRLLLSCYTIYIHIFGSHSNYQKLFPAQVARFWFLAIGKSDAKIH